MFFGTDIIPRNIPGHIPHSDGMWKYPGMFRGMKLNVKIIQKQFRGLMSVPQSTVMDLNNAMYTQFIMLTFYRSCH